MFYNWRLLTNVVLMQMNNNMMFIEARVHVGVSHPSCRRCPTIATKGSCAIENGSER